MLTLCRKRYPGRCGDGSARVGGGLQSSIYVILTFGIAAMVLLGLTWRETAVVFGQKRSVALLTNAFFAAAVDCTTSILFWPFAGLFQHKYVIALSVGEGMTGVIAAILVWIQVSPGPNASPLFSASVYFFLLGVVMLISLTAFYCLNTLKRAHMKRLDVRIYQHSDNDSASQLLLVDNRTSTDETSSSSGTQLPSNKQLSAKPNMIADMTEGEPMYEEPQARERSISYVTLQDSRHFGGRISDEAFFILLVGVLAACQNGLWTSILPYTIYSHDLLQLVQTISLCIIPLGAFLPFWYQPRFEAHVAAAVVWLITSISLLVIGIRRSRIQTDALASIAAILGSFMFSFSKS